MEKLLAYTPHILFGAGAWYLINGILHDIFVLLSDHGKKYDRDLLRLLMDGHVLIVGGAILMICFSGLKTDSPLAHYVCLVITVSMLMYVGMIWPFLKSMITGLISLFCTFLILWKLFIHQTS
jgi:hypothetical protein